MASHLAYSAEFGALYGILRTRIRGLPAPLAGAMLGLAVWGVTVSFQGWMPALGIMRATTDLPKKQWPPDIIGHVLYGAATAVTHEALENAIG